MESIPYGMLSQLDSIEGAVYSIKMFELTRVTSVAWVELIGAQFNLTLASMSYPFKIDVRRVAFALIALLVAFLISGAINDTLIAPSREHILDEVPASLWLAWMAPILFVGIAIGVCSKSVTEMLAAAFLGAILYVGTDYVKTILLLEESHRGQHASVVYFSFHIVTDFFILMGLVVVGRLGAWLVVKIRHAS